MKKIQTALSAVVLSAALFCFAGQANAATTAASSMHYGKPVVTMSTTKSANSSPIVITNCGEQTEEVSAWFTDGSSNTNMPIFPADQAPMNVISIDNSVPYVIIEVDDPDGTILFSRQPVYPGQHVNIGCDHALVGKYPAVSVSKH